jgi:hypothetical protein
MQWTMTFGLICIGACYDTSNFAERLEAGLFQARLHKGVDI